MSSLMSVMPVTSLLCHSMYSAILSSLPAPWVLAPTYQPAISHWWSDLRWVLLGVLGVLVAHLQVHYTVLVI